MRRILHVWWPLALSWLLMSLEGPAHSAIVARLTDAEINLAAWGGIVFPIALIIESPIVMLLPASTALSKDWRSYAKLRRFMLVAAATLTGLHVLIAFTPLYDVIARHLFGAPEAIIEPGRLGLMIMTPWSAAIAYRRFQQGTMIRFGHSKAVGFGTLIRLTANGIVLLGGYLIGSIPGIIVASTAVATGVTAEAVFAGLRVRPIVERQVRTAPQATEELTARSFLAFYTPLALTALMSFFVSPVGSAAISRMPNALASLAVWPVISGLVFMLRSPCTAYNEVVVALLDEPGALAALRRFARYLGIGSTLAAMAVAFTPLSMLVLKRIMALPPHLLDLGQSALWLSVVLPVLVLLQSWFQGAMVAHKQTRGISEAVTLYLLMICAILGAGVLLQEITGLYVSLAALGMAGSLQALWLWHRSRPAFAVAEARDREMSQRQRNGAAASRGTGS